MEGCEETGCDDAAVGVKVYFSNAAAAQAAARALRQSARRGDAVTLTPVGN